MPTKFPVDYEVTDLGEAVVMRIVQDNGGEEMAKDPDIGKILEDLMHTENSQET